MKKLSIIPLFLCILATATFYSCSKSNATPASATATDTLVSIISEGTWKITSMTEPGENNTSKFTGFSFTFSKDGKVTAVSNSKTTSGTWLWSGTSYYGVNVSKPIFSIDLGSGDPLRRLSHKWVVASKSQNTFSLSSSEPLEDEHVSFSRQ